MAKQFIFLCALLFLTLSVLAEEVNGEELVDAGITPDSLFYFLDTLSENIELAFTFNKELAFEKKLEFAEERLAEARKLSLEVKLKGVQIAQEKYSKLILELKSDIDKIGNDDEVEELKIKLRIEEKVREHERKIEAVNNDIKLKFEIKGELTEEKRAELDALIASFRQNTGELRVEVKNQKDKTKIKIKLKGGDGDEIEFEFEEENEIVTDEEDALEEIEDAKEEIAEAEIKILEAVNDGKETQAAEKRLNDSKMKLEQAQDMYYNENFQAAEALAENAEKFAKQAGDKFLGKTLEEVSDEIEDEKEIEIEIEEEVEEEEEIEIKID